MRACLERSQISREPAPAGRDDRAAIAIADDLGDEIDACAGQEHAVDRHHHLTQLVALVVGRLAEVETEGELDLVRRQVEHE